MIFVFAEVALVDLGTIVDKRVLSPEPTLLGYLATSVAGAGFCSVLHWPRSDSDIESSGFDRIMKCGFRLRPTEQAEPR